MRRGRADLLFLVSLFERQRVLRDIAKCEYELNRVPAKLHVYRCTARAHFVLRFVFPDE